MRTNIILIIIAVALAAALVPALRAVQQNTTTTEARQNVEIVYAIAQESYTPKTGFPRAIRIIQEVRKQDPELADTIVPVDAVSRSAPEGQISLWLSPDRKTIYLHEVTNSETGDNIYILDNGKKVIKNTRLTTPEAPSEVG